MSHPLIFPDFDPVAFHVGPLAVRWYALAYMVSFIIALPIAKRLNRLAPEVATKEQVDDFLFYAILGVLIGGRLGYVLFYRPLDYFSHPLEIFKTWDGGMSFHGGALGVILALAYFSWKNRLSFLAFADRIVPVVPIGLGLGRCANFVNGELWGRPASPDLPWAMIFPTGGPIPRHPSELYEALTEGVLLLCVMLFAASRPQVRERFGFLSGLFLFGYACARSFCEFFRQPDANIGFLSGGTTMGQLLCIPMALVGMGLMVYAMRRPAQVSAHV
ncbi:prolipoprotein diacylglyceryl transferase [Gluconobacter sphaericus NBRC 12467]|uniref:Phosphatidylglycerol--prolipoprotein diacylglyceryl transferase n=1 Tax=Gluconobacter sphaericus NBRC 12467 TaxID=1307951 RepID=A0AA37SJ64_9PROT|nr:prolipoprotein diacylglyceryl transferase [Gluconobacter sphaericus]MBS1086977.1 prolipoprotein diacylglyceryl transferase [Gluconobacter sphaericus]MBS1100932.1 prolipoprotein diacylglyceryl transferase [Gluconobacter sphaericus]QQX92153.1 prolipoprotein diacylglyceryl transferase [Gluconobacter sphaericus]GBR55584.1 prolipoprotein diacylglyceryl transferase [Gluconobacter sphaericus NBRC 12467]GEB43189.1 prolipoprotein diacylglyceryl transferase [Gluconobacter sphaericus NBRC 12467]